jgi:hypothetical protein
MVTCNSLIGNSLIAHIDQLRIFIHSLRTNIDVLAINETKLDSSITNRRDRLHQGRNGGGVCLYVKSNLNFKIRDDLANKYIDLIFVQISNDPRSRPFLVGTWYRPPSSAQHLFPLFQDIIDKIDPENSELYLLGHLNCDLLSQTPHANTLELLDIFDIYNLTQHITEPTRVTSTSQSLLDLCITNTPGKIKVSGVLSLGISDDSLIYFVRKSTWQRQFANSFTRKRHFKHFNDNEFLNDLNEIDWNEISSSDDTNVVWSMWLTNFTQILDKHAPFKKKRIGKKKSPWITPDVVQKMRARDYLKKQYDKNRNNELWKQYKNTRNDVNNIIKQAKCDYFKDRIDVAKKDPKQTWKLVNELSSRNTSNEIKEIKEIKFPDKEVTNASAIADAFNSHFTSIGERLASNIDRSNTDPTFYIKPKNTVFSFNRIETHDVTRLLETVNSNKATGLDGIPGRICCVSIVD